MQNHKNCCNNSGKEQGKMDTEFDEDDTKENDAIIAAENCNRHRTNKEETNPEEGLPNENGKNAETRTTLQAMSSTASTTETSVRGPLDNSETKSTKNPEVAMLGEQTNAASVIHEDIKVKNAFAVQVGNNNVVRSGPSHEREDPAMVGATVSLPHVQSVNFSPGQVLVYRNVQIENCKYVQVGDNNSVVIEKVTPQEDAFVKACCELDINPKTADDIREKLSNRDVLEQFAKKMETYQVTCKIRAATRGCILLELEVPTEEDRLQLLCMARDGTFQQVLLETFLPEFAAEGRAVSMNLAIGVRNPSQDMVEELQGATASSGGWRSLTNNAPRSMK
ncbi:uncharacterized protein [Branchiostoma lanceolatum]|uniref:uncharacterized protein n=1 Tax=Branchiostoma lanceolatum TaxID=7740 RepID=UPI003455E391